MEDANVTCRQLGYRRAVAALGGAYSGESVGTDKLDSFECSSQEERLVDCPHSTDTSANCTYDNDAGVVCYISPEESRGILLVNDNDTAGRVEVYVNGAWGTVCDDHWDLDDAHVACRQLGFSGASEATSKALFGQGEDPTQMDDMECSGYEESLDDCPHVGSSSGNCGHHEDAGVVCYTATEETEIGAIRLVSGNNTAGRVEIYLDGRWGTICDDSWDMTDDDVVCRQLGFYGAEAAPTRAHFGEGTGWTQMDDVECRGDEQRLVDCAYTDSGDEDCGHFEDAGAVCVVRGDM